MSDSLAKMVAAYRDSRVDEKAIQEDGGGLSILFDAEIVSDAFAGIATSWVNGRDISLSDCQRTLLKSAREASGTLERWVAEKGAQFPSFTRYLQAILSLRDLILPLLPPHLRGDDPPST